MNIVTVKINGVEYNLKGNENEEYLHKVASYVDKKLKGITENNSKLSTASAAMLTALNAVDDLLKKESLYKEALDKLRAAEEKESMLKQQLSSQDKQIKQLEAYNEELKNRSTNSQQEKRLKEYEDTISSIKEERNILQKTAKKYLEENNRLKNECKEYKFENQTYKYKIMELQHKFLESQIDLVKEKKQSSPLLNVRPKL